MGTHQRSDKWAVQWVTLSPGALAPEAIIAWVILYQMLVQGRRVVQTEACPHRWLFDDGILWDGMLPYAMLCHAAVW